MRLNILFNNTKKCFTKNIVLIILAGLLIRSFFLLKYANIAVHDEIDWLGPGLSIIENRTLTFMVKGYSFTPHHPILTLIPFAIPWIIGGIIGIRISLLFFYIITAIIIYLVTKSLYDISKANIATLVYALSPLFINISIIITPEPFITMIGFMLTLYLIKSKNINIPIFAISIIYIIFSSWEYMFIFLTIYTILYIFLKRKIELRIILITILITLGYLAQLILYKYIFISYYDSSKMLASIINRATRCINPLLCIKYIIGTIRTTAQKITPIYPLYLSAVLIIIYHILYLIIDKRLKVNRINKDDHILFISLIITILTVTMLIGSTIRYSIVFLLPLSFLLIDTNTNISTLFSNHKITYKYKKYFILIILLFMIIYIMTSLYYINIIFYTNNLYRIYYIISSKIFYNIIILFIFIQAIIIYILIKKGIIEIKQLIAISVLFSYISILFIPFHYVYDYAYSDLCLYDFTSTYNYVKNIIAKNNFTYLISYKNIAFTLKYIDNIDNFYYIDYRLYYLSLVKDDLNNISWSIIKYYELDKDPYRIYKITPFKKTHAAEMFLILNYINKTRSLKNLVIVEFAYNDKEVREAYSYFGLKPVAVYGCWAIFVLDN